MEANPSPTLKDRYPHLSDEQIAEVADAWERYLALVSKIFKRLQAQRLEGHLT